MSRVQYSITLVLNTSYNTYIPFSARVLLFHLSRYLGNPEAVLLYLDGSLYITSQST
jgi:hypothetical protein